MRGKRGPSRSRTKASTKRGDETKLVRRAKQGDKQAISELYRRHVDAIYRYVWARVGDGPVAEDLTAQVFLKALEGLPTYEPGGTPFLAWLYRIAYARVVDHWRRQGRRSEVPLAETLPARDPQPDEFVDAVDEWRTAIDLIVQLTDEQQEVLFLRFIGEMSLAEVAEILGKTIGAIKSTQHRALASLARLQRQRAASEYHGG